jgi:hypothetical protein
MKRRVTALACTAVFAIGAAACGSGAGGPATISIGALQQAADNSQRADTQSFEFTADLDVKGQSLAMHGSGVVAGDGTSGRLAMSIPSVGDIQEILTPDGSYIDMGAALGTRLPDGKRWVFMSYADLSGQGGADLQSLRGDGGQTSSQALEYLQATSGDVEKVGEDTVNGSPATHYVTHVDYGEWSEQHMPDATPEQKAAVAKLGVVPMDVWIDGQDRVVKLSFEVGAPGLGGDGGRMKMTMQITGFGAPLDVQAPPADEVISLSDLQHSSAA